MPKLLHSLRRVWPEYDLGPEAGKVLTNGLEILRSDHESGARQLAARAIFTLRDVIEKMDSSTADDFWWSNVRMTAWHLWKNGRESMGAAIVSALVTVLDCIEQQVQKEGVTNNERTRRALSVIDKCLSERDLAISRVNDTFTTYLKTLYEQRKKTLTILTLSNSSTISTCLLNAADTLSITLDVLILESRPLCDGVTLATNVSKHKNINTTIYSDASAAFAAKGVDVLVLGADRISAKGDVSNKIGSLPAVLSV